MANPKMSAARRPKPRLMLRQARPNLPAGNRKRVRKSHKPEKAALEAQILNDEAQHAELAEHIAVNEESLHRLKAKNDQLAEATSYRTLPSNPKIPPISSFSPDRERRGKV